MNEPVSRPARRTWLWVAGAVLLVPCALAVWYGHRQWQAHQTRTTLAEAATTRQLEALEQSIQALRRDQRANARAIQDAAATNRVLRDEVLGLGQRSALLEANLAQLAASNRGSVPALRREEAELLLRQAQQRLEYAGDLEGARRLYALAAEALAGIDQPGDLNVRQALMQERAALDALGPGVVTRLDEQLLQLGRDLQQVPEPAPADAKAPWWHQLLSPLVRIQPTQGTVLVGRADRLAAQDALQVELTLARAALARGDADGYRQALERVEAWLLRLWPDSPTRATRQAELRALREADLNPVLPELGSPLQQLRALRTGRNDP